MILVTGGGGLLGLNLAKDLADKGQEVLIFQRHEVEVPAFLIPYWNKEVKSVTGDLLEWPLLCDLITRYRIDSIVHAAAVWPGRIGTTSLAQVISINVLATHYVLEVARVFKLRRVTFISSETVYLGVKATEPCHEDMPLPATSPEAISATKKASEQICGLYSKMHGMSVPILRVARIYGPTAHWRRNPMERMIVHSVEGKPADVPDTYEGSYTVPIHAKDCANGISFVHLATQLKHNVFNLADGNHVSYGEIASMVREVLPNADIRLSKDRNLELSIPSVSIERLESTGWSPKFADLREGIRAYIDYLKEGKY
jgi:nucleoside-diphosphate-sugar epimerase